MANQTIATPDQEPAQAAMPRGGGKNGAGTAVTIIAAKRAGFFPARELWEFRELLYFLTWRDIKVRYKQTVIGAAWAIVQPVVTIVIFSTIFGRFARIPSDGIPYPVFAFSGLLAWQLFAGALQRSTQSVVGSASLITKVYFPRLVIPIAATFSTVVDFLIALAVLVTMALFFGIAPTWRIVVLPALTCLALLAALAVGLWLSALNVRYRDVGHAIPFLVQIWMFASPVVYPTTLVPERWHLLYGLNPMVGVIEGFRWVLLAKAAPNLAMMLVSGSVVLLLLAGGLVYFRRTERMFADVI